jgi:hypothetical protein
MTEDEYEALAAKYLTALANRDMIFWRGHHRLVWDLGASNSSIKRSAAQGETPAGQANSSSAYYRGGAMITLGERLSLFWYNHVKRIWDNWRWRHGALYRAWIAEGRDPRYFPRAGRLTPQALLWAKRMVDERKGAHHEMRGPRSR